MDKKYIYLGNKLNLPEFNFNKGSIYFGDKIEELKEKYPLLNRLLISVDDLNTQMVNEVIFSKITEELIEQIEGSDK